MMMSLLWYYRPEHLDHARPDDLPDEVYASRHRDVASVACIDDKCYVMTFNEYCRYGKILSVGMVLIKHVFSRKLQCSIFPMLR